MKAKIIPKNANDTDFQIFAKVLIEMVEDFFERHPELDEEIRKEEENAPEA